MRISGRIFSLGLGALCVGLGGYFVGTARAAGIPATATMAYAGVIHNAQGQPIDDAALPIGVSLWDVPANRDVSHRHCEVPSTTTAVAQGRFRVVLPEACVAAVQANPELYVEVTLAGNPLPRQKIGAVPYAVESGHAVSSDRAAVAVEAGRATTAGGALAQQVVPSGAVMAFDLAACPAGWAPLPEARGRTIIGVNTGNGNGLSNRALRATLGSETHTLTVSEMPTHNHLPAAAPNRVLSFNVGGRYGAVAGSMVENLVGENDANPTTNLAPAGGSQAHDIMQPSLALLYCRKT